MSLLQPHHRAAGPSSARSVALVMLVLLPGVGPAGAAPASANWTLTEIGDLAGGADLSVALGINKAGKVVGYSGDGTGDRAFLWNNGTLTNLGDLAGGPDGSYALAINAQDQVVGYSRAATGDRGFLWQGGTLTNLGDLAGGADFSIARAINDAGQIVGESNGTFSWGSGTGNVNVPFLWEGGSMRAIFAPIGDLRFAYAYGINGAGQVAGRITDVLSGDRAARGSLDSGGTAYQWEQLPRWTLEASGSAINDAGVVAGRAFNDLTSAVTVTRPVVWSPASSSPLDLGSLPGGSEDGQALALDNHGHVVGWSGATGGNRAFLWRSGTMTNLNTLAGVAGTGWTLTSADGINDLGQIAVNGTNPGGKTRGGLLTLSTIVWEAGSGGSFSDANGWSFGVAPNPNAHAIVDPARSLAITGPAGDVTVKQLTIGGGPTGNNGIATLVLNGGRITVVGSGGSFTTVTTRGVLTGDGILAGAVVNDGDVRADNLTLTGGLTNRARVGGSGWLAAKLNNTSTGTVRVRAGEELRLANPGIGSHTNSGLIEVRGGELSITGQLTNNAGGRIVLVDAALRLAPRLVNSGQLLVTSGQSLPYGELQSLSGGRLILSGLADATIFDKVDVQSGAELRVSTGATATFFGPVYIRTGALLTGNGTKFFEGGVFPGSSPGLLHDEGSITLGPGNRYAAEIGGELPGIGHDKLDVAGHLRFGGTLELSSWAGLVAAAGQRFDLFDWGSASGRFDRIEHGGLRLGEQVRLDLSRLYADGTIGIAAVPEPASQALMVAGLLLIGAAARRAAVRPVAAR